MPTTDTTFDLTGLEALKSGAATLAQDIEAQTKPVAQAAAARVLANARANLAARTRGEGNTAAALVVEEDAPNLQYMVRFGLIRNRPANLPLWLEYGFMLRNRVHRPGTYFMHDAARAEDAGYATALSEAAVRPVRALLEGGS